MNHGSLKHWQAKSGFRKLMPLPVSIRKLALISEICGAGNLSIERLLINIIFSGVKSEFLEIFRNYRPLIKIM